MSLSQSQPLEESPVWVFLNSFLMFSQLLGSGQGKHSFNVNMASDSEGQQSIMLVNYASHSRMDVWWIFMTDLLSFMVLVFLLCFIMIFKFLSHSSFLSHSAYSFIVGYLKLKNRTNMQWTHVIVSLYMESAGCIDWTLILNLYVFPPTSS